MPSTPKKLERLSHDTFAQLSKRLYGVPIDWSSILPEDVYKFIDAKAKGYSACTGYFIASLLGTTSYIIGLSSTLKVHQGAVKPNLYLLLNGPPTTCKSTALKECCVGPMKLLSESFVEETGLTIQNCTSAALTKHLSKHKHAMLVSPEVFDLLRKLIKSDQECASGDVSLLCSIFSGEEVTMSYATEGDRVIPANTPFCILGAIQTPATAKLLAMLDNGQGLVDRVLLLSPLPIRPTPAESKTAIQSTKDSPISDFSQVFYEMYTQHEEAREYHLDDEASELMQVREEEFINQINEALMNGLPTPQNKTTDITVRLALAIHVLSSTMSALLQKRKPQIETAIPKDCILKASQLTEYAEAQKEVILTFLHNLVSDVKETAVTQPEVRDVKQAILLSPGAVVTVRSFKTTARTHLRLLTSHEVAATMKEMDEYGDVHTIRLRGQGRDSIVFVKKTPRDLNVDDMMVSKLEYDNKYALPPPKSIGLGLRKYLHDRNIATFGEFANQDRSA